jgi:hypothetical protein
MATARLLADDDGVLGNDLDCAVILDVHDAASHSLAVGDVDEDVVAWSPARLWLVHTTRMRATPRPGLRVRPGKFWC